MKIPVAQICKLGYCARGQKAFYKAKGWDVRACFNDGVEATWFKNDLSPEAQVIFKWALKNGYVE